MVVRKIDGKYVGVEWDEILERYNIYIEGKPVGSAETAPLVSQFVEYCLGVKCHERAVLRVVKEEGAFDPFRGHESDAGLDLCSREDKPIWPGSSEFFDVGIRVELPEGYYGKIESRSGLNKNHHVVCCGGVIDQGYRGSIGVILYNFGKETFFVKKGDRIAQMIIQPYIAPKIEFVDVLDETERNENGFGSTGE